MGTADKAWADFSKAVQAHERTVAYCNRPVITPKGKTMMTVDRARVTRSK